MRWNIHQAADGRRAERSRRAWNLARRQHGVLSRTQLIELGFSSREIRTPPRVGTIAPCSNAASMRWVVLRSRHTVAGWPPFSPAGMVPSSVTPARLRCGASGSSDARLVELSLPSQSRRRRPGLRIHRRPSLRARDVTAEYGIPVITPVQTMIDLSLRLDRRGRGADDQRGGQIRPCPSARVAQGTRRTQGRAGRRQAPPDPRPSHLPPHQGGARTALRPARSQGRPAGPARPASG